MHVWVSGVARARGAKLLIATGASAPAAAAAGSGGRQAEAALASEVLVP